MRKVQEKIPEALTEVGGPSEEDGVANEPMDSSDHEYKPKTWKQISS